MEDGEEEGDEEGKEGKGKEEGGELVEGYDERVVELCVTTLAAEQPELDDEKLLDAWQVCLVWSHHHVVSSHHHVLTDTAGCMAEHPMAGASDPAQKEACHRH